MKRKRAGIWAVLLVLGAVSLLLAAFTPSAPPRLLPSGLPRYVPQPGESFSDYLSVNRQRIRDALEAAFSQDDAEPFGTGYPIEKVLAMRAPFELEPDASRCREGDNAPARGFLLIHGLTDSPFLLSELAASLAADFPCALIRSLLLPGHGTQPGDLLDVSLADWRQTVSYGVAGFTGLVEELTLVGYSNGASLAIDYLQNNPQQQLVSGLILLSPGLAAAQRSIALAPYLKYLRTWVSQGTDRDPAKYDSMPMHAAALFYQLTRQITANEQPLSVPVLMVVSGDDTTVDSQRAADYFCTRVPASASRLLWYRSPVTGSSPRTECSGIQIIDSSGQLDRFFSHSHVAISMSPRNPHYGLDGLYPLCTAYADSPELLQRCQQDNQGTVYGENTLRGEDRLFRGMPVRRASFNPYYDEMLDTVRCFIESNCAG